MVVRTTPAGRIAILVIATVGMALVAYVAFVFLGLMGMAGNQVEHDLVAFDLSPDGRSVVFSSASGGLFVLDLRSKQVEELPGAPKADATMPKFSPDRKSVAFLARDPGGGGASLCSVPVSGGAPTLLVDGSQASVGAFAFSSDGRRLCFMRAYRHRPYSMGGMVWDDSDVSVLDLGSGRERRLTHETYYGGGNVAFVDGGSAVLYCAEGHGERLASSLHKVGLAAKAAPEAFMPQAAGFGGGAWASDLSASRDGRLLAFISDRERSFAYDVFVGDPSGRNVRPLHITNISGYNASPVIAPDEKTVYFLAGGERNPHGRAIFSLYRTDLDGHATEVADSGLFTDPLHWRRRL
jgi:Tol biopolymer transport system component